MRVDEQPKARQPGQMVGPWRLVRLLGAGSFGATWEAEGEDGRAVAVKLLPESPGDEVRALSRVCHPGVVGLVGAGERPQSYLVMELARGRSLGDLLGGGAIPSDHAASIAGVLFDGLAAVHRAGLLHGDVKPDNLIVRSPRQVWLVDFGMAGQRSGGTVAYAAPELLDGGERGTAADVYSAGLVLWEMLHGSLPFAELDDSAALARRADTAPDPRTGAPWLRELLTSVLQVDPLQRPSAAQVADTLASHGVSLPEPTPELLRRRARSTYLSRDGADDLADTWLNEGGRIAVCGPPGGGRSHLLGRLAIELYAQGRQFLRMSPVGARWSAIRDEVWRLGLKHRWGEGGDRDARAEQLADLLVEQLGDGACVLVDDLEALDDGSRAVVEMLARRSALAICAVTEEPPSWVGHVIALPHFDADGVRRLCEAVLGGTGDLSPLVARALELGGGRPGPVVALAQAALRDGALVHRAGSWSCVDTVLAEVVVEGRESVPLSPAGALVGALTAIHEHPLPLGALAGLAGLTRSEVADAIDELVALGQCRVEGAHLRVVDAAARQALDRCAVDSRDLHGRIARWLATLDPVPLSRLVWHAAVSGDVHRARVDGAEAMRQAAEGDPVLAERLSEALWAVAPSPELLALRLDAMRAVGKVDAAMELGTAGLAGRPDELADLDVLLALARLRVHHFDDASGAQALLDRAERLLEDGTAPGAMRLVQAQVALRRGDTQAAIRHARAVAERRPPRDRRRLRLWLRARLIWVQGLFKLQRLEEALGLLSELDPSLGEGTTTRALLVAAHGRLLLHAGRLRDAEGMLAEASEARSGLSLLDRARLVNNLGAVRYSVGTRGAAVEAWEQALTLFQRLGVQVEIVRVNVNLCLGYKEQGRWERARQAGELAMRSALELGLSELTVNATENLAELALARGHWSDAESWIDLSESQAVAGGFERDLCELARMRAQLAVYRQDEDALDRATAAEDLARCYGKTVEASLAAALKSVALARAGVAGEAEQAIRQALLPLQELGATAELAKARLWTGRALMELDQLEPARREISQVRLYARETGDVPLRDEAAALHVEIEERLSAGTTDNRLDRLVELAVGVGQETSLAGLYERLARATLGLVPGERVFVLLGAPPALVASHSLPRAPTGRPSQTVIDQCLRNRKPVTAMDLGERGDLRDQASIMAMDLRSVLCVPLLRGDDVIGVIYVDSRSTGRSGLWETAQLMRGLAALSATAIARLQYQEVAVEQAARAARLQERQHSEGELANLAQELSEKNAQLEKLNRRLQRAVTTDPLTGIGNRRHMMRSIERAHREALGLESDYGLLVIDIDHFKRFNDEYGHETGDRALVHVTRVISSQLRESDLLFRYGGEEMVVLAPRVGPESLRRLAERVCQAVHSSAFAVTGEISATVTVSVGAARWAGGEGSWDDLLRAADQALYAAKQGGRDRVRLWTSRAVEAA